MSSHYAAHQSVFSFYMGKTVPEAHGMGLPWLLILIRKVLQCHMFVQTPNEFYQSLAQTLIVMLPSGDRD